MKKTYGHLLLPVVLLLCTLSVYGQQPVQSAKAPQNIATALKNGDVNGDGQYTVTDVVMMVNHIIGNSSSGYHTEVSDMNNDGITTVTDVMILVNIIIGQANIPQGDDDNPVIPVGDPEGGDPKDGV